MWKVQGLGAGEVFKERISMLMHATYTAKAKEIQGKSDATLHTFKVKMILKYFHHFRPQRGLLSFVVGNRNSNVLK